MAKKEEEEKKSLGRRFKDAVKKELGIPDLTGVPRGGLFLSLIHISEPTRPY